MITTTSPCLDARRLPSHWHAHGELQSCLGVLEGGAIPLRGPPCFRCLAPSLFHQQTSLFLCQ